MIADEEFFRWLEIKADALVGLHPDDLIYAIRRSCEIKADVVAADEREGGIRAILNFGHTFGHAIETDRGYGSWLHGEAVGAGMVVAARLSVSLGGLTELEFERIQKLIATVGLPTAVPADMTAE